MRTRYVLLAVLGLSAPAATASAQDLEAPRQRQGYYVAGGFHAALSYSRNDGENVGPLSGLGTTIRIGELLTPRLGLGMDIDFATGSGDGKTAAITGLGVSGQVEIVRNLALHASFGLGILNLDDPDEDELTGGYGTAYTLALTYDWFLGNRRSGGWALTPGIRARAVPSDTIDAFAVLAGLEISYWTGRPKNQLALPDSEAYGRGK